MPRFSLPRALVVLGCSVALVLSAQAGVPVSADPVGTAVSTSSLARTAQSGSLKMLPQLAQPGRRTAKASKARSSMVAIFQPATAGRAVKLQRSQNGRWKTVATKRTSRQGRAEFNAKFRHRGKVATYRAVAAAADGRPALATDAVKANHWGAPDVDTAFGGKRMPEPWGLRGQEYSGYRECSKVSKKSVAVRKGALRLSVKKHKSRTRKVGKCRTSYGRFDWRLTGMVATEGRRTVGYGVAAARIKFQPLRGQHGAFWMQPAEADPRLAEVDAVEWFGGNHPSGGLTGFVHFTDRNGVRKKAGPQGVTTDGAQFIPNPGRFGNQWAKKFHVFSVEWARDRYIFRIDGRETFRTDQGLSKARKFLILSLQSSTYEMPFLDGDPAAPHSAKRLPQSMSVDWVRYWER